jgi:hypothetical protein
VAGTLISPRESRAQNGRRPPLSMMSAVTASWPRVNSDSGIDSPASRRRSMAWSPMSWPMLMLLRAWIGANDDAIASRLPENTSHCAAVSRLEPTPFCAPEAITSKLPPGSAFSGNSRWPPTTRPAYAFLAICAGS